MFFIDWASLHHVAPDIHSHYMRLKAFACSWSVLLRQQQNLAFRKFNFPGRFAKWFLPNNVLLFLYCIFLGEKRKHLRHTFSISCKIGQKGPPSGGLPLPRNPRSVKCCFLHLFYDKIVDPMYRIQSSTVINKVSNSPVPHANFHFTKTRAVTTSAFIPTTPPPLLPTNLFASNRLWLCLGADLDCTGGSCNVIVFRSGAGLHTISCIKDRLWGRVFHKMVDRTWRATVHSDHYVTGSVPRAGIGWGCMYKTTIVM